MKTTGIFHPNWFYHARPVVESAMIAEVEIYEPTSEPVEWQPGVGITNDPLILRWKGKARIQPNKDWRARDRDFSGEFDSVHAIRVQVGINKNKYDSPDASEDFAKSWIVVVTDCPVQGSEVNIGDRYWVRNAKMSSNLWLHNLLCDTGTKED